MVPGRGMSPGCPGFLLELRSVVVPFTKAGNTEVEWRRRVGRVRE